MTIPPGVERAAICLANMLSERSAPISASWLQEFITQETRADLVLALCEKLLKDHATSVYSTCELCGLARQIQAALGGGKGFITQETNADLTLLTLELVELILQPPPLVASDDPKLAAEMLYRLNEQHREREIALSRQIQAALRKGEQDGKTK